MQCVAGHSLIDSALLDLPRDGRLECFRRYSDSELEWFECHPAAGSFVLYQHLASSLMCSNSAHKAKERDDVMTVLRRNRSMKWTRGRGERT